MAGKSGNKENSPNENFFELIKKNNIKYVDFRFTDPKGKTQHTSYDVRQIDADAIKNGIMIDGSSISGWKEIDESDMIIKPDVETAFIDPFTAHPTICVVCDVIEPETGLPYSRDPRSTAKAAEEYLIKSGIGDTIYFGPEPEFFVFDDVRYGSQMNSSFYSVDSREGTYNSGTQYEGGNLAHRPKIKGGYFPVQPVDSFNDMRAEMLEMLEVVGLTPVLHHHEVAPSQLELGIMFSTLTDMADKVQSYKYVVHNVADMYGKSATFMPKPIAGDNGSGMHCHQSVWKDGKNLFAGDKYAGLSQECLWYIGGIIKHAKAINAFTNSTTNSYKRLVPGYEAPVHLAYSSLNRSASIRIPHVHNAKGKRIECRFPDPVSNPYFAFSAMLMAGIDGIKNKIDPGKAADKNLYALPEAELRDIPRVARSLHEALDSLDADRKFLTAGGVFKDDQIDAYIRLKMVEVIEWEATPHPIEFINTYSS